LLHILLHFGRLLRSLGLDVQAGRMPDVAAALQHIDIGRRSDFHATLRSLLIHRQQDLATFDQAFRLFWRPPSGDRSSTDLQPIGERRGPGAPQVEVPASQPDPGDLAGWPVRPETTMRIAPASYSPREVSRVKDFAELDDEELAQAQAMIDTLRWDVGMRSTRRWKPGDGRTLDLKRVVRRNLGTGGEPLALPRRQRLAKRRPLVVICDVSGSMERYVRLLLHFISQIAGRLARVDAFVFATRLTRITHELGWRGSRHALPAIPRRVPDWAGGTRIGDALRTFNVRWARRVMSHGPVVLLISDGWDRGEPARLALEMGRLQRSCHRLIWLNPLLGAADYQPLTRGMQAALPFIDDFLPVHNLASLEALALHLNRLPSPRRARRGSGG
jgi:uncharacterized protein with von Willebrand factor type A (vWA) domain